MPIKILLTVMVIACLVSCASNTGNTANNHFPQALDTSDPKQKGAYAAGFLQMEALLSVNKPFDRGAFSTGLYDALNKQAPKMSKPDMEQLVDWRQSAQVNLEVIKQTTLKPGQVFLEKKKSQPDIKTLASGLQYKVLKKGNGKLKPKISDTVRIYYQYTGIDGKSLNNIAIPGKIVSDAIVSRVPKGMQEALLMMDEGAEWQLSLPSALAYGEIGFLSYGILPNETILCNLELAYIKQPK